MKDTTFIAIVSAILFILCIVLSFSFQSCCSTAKVEIVKEVVECL